MNLKLVAVVGLVGVWVGCAAEPDRCGPDNCPGCCATDGQCHLGTEDALCGRGGYACDICSDRGAVCENMACHGAPVTGNDGGPEPKPDAGEPDAGPVIDVTITYYRIVDAGTTVCPPQWGADGCGVTKSMTTSRAEYLATHFYSNCQIEDYPATHRRGFNCLHNCDGRYSDLTCDDGSGPVTYSWPDCTYPEFTLADRCEWTVAP